MKKILQILLASTMVFGLIGIAQAAEVLHPSDQNPNITVGANETHKNLYTAGANVVINGKTAGDLTVAGGMVTVAGNVEQQLLAAGGTLNITGSVGNTARVAGGNITISGPVGGDLVVAGGNISLTGTASVGGDLLVTGGNIVVDAPVTGGARITGGNITINNKINGDVYVRSGQSLTFGPSAVVTGTVYHQGTKQAVVENGAKVPNIQYSLWQPRGRGKGAGALKAFLTVAFFVRFIAWMLAAWLLVHFKRSWFIATREKVGARPWAMLGWGLIYFIVIPVVAIVLLFTILGYYAAFIIGSAYLLLLFSAKVVAIVTLGLIIHNWFSKRGTDVPMWQPIVIGAIVWSLLDLIPVVGWIIGAIVYLMTVGALTQTVTSDVRE